MRYFRLKKDLPGLPAGTIFDKSFSDSNETYLNYIYEFTEEKIQTYTEWFEEVWKCEMCGEYFNNNEGWMLTRGFYNGKYICDKCKEEKKTVKIEPLKELGFCKMNSNKINEIIDYINIGKSETVKIEKWLVRGKTNEGYYYCSVYIADNEKCKYSQYEKVRKLYTYEINNT